MAQELAPIFGNGSDGFATLSGTDAPIDSSCSGTSGATSLSATNASFVAGQRILIHQTRGTGVGQYEENTIASYSAGTITTVLPLSYTYTDSGSSQAQVLVLKQYSGVLISADFFTKTWDGDVGGICAFLCSGKVTISADLSGSVDSGGVLGVGFRAGPAQQTGESQAAAAPGNATTNAGAGEGATQQLDGGGGGAHASVGGNGGGTGTGAGGTAYGQADLALAMFGSGGGGGGSTNNGGGRGGGFVRIITRELEITTGTITANGAVAGTTSPGDRGGSGGGGGGSIFIKAVKAVIGTNLVTATGGAADPGTGTGTAGGNGSDGRIRIEACYLSGTTNPPASESIGGKSYCGSAVQII